MLRYWWLAAGLGALFLGCTPQAAQKKENTMAKEATQGTAITLKGETVHTTGHLPAVGREAPDFTLTAEDISAKTLKDLKGKNIILNNFISVNKGCFAISAGAGPKFQPRAKRAGSAVSASANSR